MGANVYITEKQINIIWKIMDFTENVISIEIIENSLDNPEIEDMGNKEIYNELKKIYESYRKNKARSRRIR